MYLSRGEILGWNLEVIQSFRIVEIDDRHRKAYYTEENIEIERLVSLFGCLVPH